MLIGVAPPIPWQREIEGAETHWSAPSGLGAPLKKVSRTGLCHYVILISVCWIIVIMYMYMYVCVYEVQGRQHVNDI